MGKGTKHKENSTRYKHNGKIYVILTHTYLLLQSCCIITYKLDFFYVFLILLFSLQRKTVRRWIQRYQATGDMKCDHQGPRPIAYTNESKRQRNMYCESSLSGTLQNYAFKC